MPSLRTSVFSSAIFALLVSEENEGWRKIRQHHRRVLAAVKTRKKLDFLMGRMRLNPAYLVFSTVNS